MFKFFQNRERTIAKIVFAGIAATVFFSNMGTVRAASNFRDIDTSSAYAKASIIRLAENDIISGDNGYFNPLRTVKRSEMVKMLVKSLNIDTSNIPDVPDFKDVPKTDWAYDFVEAAYKAGIIEGTSTGVFSPDKECTREEMAAMFARSSGLSDADFKSQESYMFVDGLKDKDGISGWAKGSVEFAMAAGLMEGTGSDTFSAKKSAQRQQVAVVTDRLITNRQTVDRFAKNFRGEFQYPELYQALDEGNKHFKGNVDMNLVISGKDESGINAANIGMGMTGLLDAAANNFDITYNMSVKLSDEIPSIDQQFQVIKLGDKYYVKEQGSEAWTVQSKEEFEQLGVSEGDYSSDELLKSFRYFTVTKTENTDYNGTAATKYSLEMNKNVMKAYISGIASEQGGIIGDSESMPVKDVSGTIEIFLDKNNQVLNEKLNFNVIIWDEETKSDVTLNITLDAKYISNPAVEIKAPTSAAK